MCIRKVFMERWSKSDQNGLDLINFPKESYHIEILFDMSYWFFEAYELFKLKIIQCKLVVNIKKGVDINEYKYVYIKLVHAGWKNWQYALTMQVPFGDTAL